MIDTIIFDCDGVVLNTSPAWLESSRVLLARRNIIYKPQEIRHRLTGKTLIDSSKIMIDFYNLTETPEELTKERFDLVGDLIRQDTNFIDGFLDFVTSIKDKYKISIATSMRPQLFEIADQKLNITKLFKGHVYFGENLRDASKPKPDIFLHAAKMTNSKPETCLVIEDAPNGIDAAKNAGMLCVAITTTFKSDLLTKADKIVNHFSEINLSKF